MITSNLSCLHSKIHRLAPALLITGFFLFPAAILAETDHAQHEAHSADAPAEKGNTGEREIAYWVAPMDPGYRRDEPGKSPMGMDLVPVYVDELETPGQVKVASAGIRQAINLRTASVEKGRLWRRIDTVGRVELDQTTVHHLHPRVEGWIRHLDIASEGDVVSAGQRLFTLYSPTLINAQEDFLRALRRDETKTIHSTRQRLAALGIQNRFIRQLEQQQNVVQAVPWYAEGAGIVTMLGVRHGMYVTPALEILELSRLDQLWIMADVFDRHTEWLSVRQPVEIRSSHHPGSTFKGETGFIYPLLDSQTRTTRVRIPLANPDNTLKPGMWVDVRIFAGPEDDLLIIPREALIRTGKHERVVVRLEEDLFEIREVIAGMHSGDYVAIVQGLTEGEQVVTSGHFFLDSEAAMQTGGSSGGGSDHHQH